jgi:hypothetical protein
MNSRKESRPGLPESQKPIQKYKVKENIKELEQNMKMKLQAKVQ